MDALLFHSSPWVLTIVSLVVLAALAEVPYRVRAFIPPLKGSDGDWNVVQTGLFTLATFVLGLSFAQAAERYDTRRALVVKEANAIGTTWLRADQLDQRDARTFRRILTVYTDQRLKAYRDNSPDVVRRTIAVTDVAQAKMWDMVSSQLAAHPTNQGLSLLMQTLNDTIDLSAEQLQELTVHVPTAIVSLMLALTGLAAFSAGLRFARDGSRPALLSAIFVIATAVVVVMVVDYDRPQAGLVRVNLAPLDRQLQAMQDQ